MRKNFYDWQIDADDFLNCCSEYVVEVTEIVANVFEHNFGLNVNDENLIIKNLPKDKNPFTERKNNTIYLNVDGAYYMQIIYQLSHELLHYILFDKSISVPSEIRWLEETFCELSSLLVLEVLTRKDFGSYNLANNSSNTEAAKNYLNLLLEKNKRFLKLSHTTSIELYARKQQMLKRQCYRRRFNLVFAVEMFDDIVKNGGIKKFWQQARKIISQYNIKKNFNQNLYGVEESSLSARMEKIFFG